MILLIINCIIILIQSFSLIEIIKQKEINSAMNNSLNIDSNIRYNTSINHKTDKKYIPIIENMQFKLD